MIRNPRLEARRKNIKKDIDIYVNKSFDMADRIHELIKKNKIDQRILAEMLGKRESEISKWLTGTHNFTLRTLSLIENALQDDVILVAGKELYKVKTKVIFVSTKPYQIEAKKKSTEVKTHGRVDAKLPLYIGPTTMLS